jgi:hypothetical protein
MDEAIPRAPRIARLAWGQIDQHGAEVVDIGQRRAGD